MQMRLVQPGRAALNSFLLSASIGALVIIGAVHSILGTLVSYLWIPLCAIHVVYVQKLILTSYRKSNLYHFAWRGALLGNVFGIGLVWSLYTSNVWSPFGIYLCVLSGFHFTEFMTTAIIKPKSLKLDSFLLNHSKEYVIAAVSSWAEFFIESYLFPSLKELYMIKYLGLMLCIGGECVRKAAMFTAGSNFNHIVQLRREDGHELVTHGVYSFCRHPSYVGWFYWSIGTQLILINPICAVGYSLASWSFFKSRIDEEEITLLDFFGPEYVDYMKKVSTGLPFIEGQKEELN